MKIIVYVVVATCYEDVFVDSVWLQKSSAEKYLSDQGYRHCYFNNYKKDDDEFDRNILESELIVDPKEALYSLCERGDDEA